jgi:hypothetical protein
MDRATNAWLIELWERTNAMHGSYAKASASGDGAAHGVSASIARFTATASGAGQARQYEYLGHHEGVAESVGIGSGIAVIEVLRPPEE